MLLALLYSGYFDAFGNYIEYRLDANARDAWLDSLSDGCGLPQDMFADSAFLRIQVEPVPWSTLLHQAAVAFGCVTYKYVACSWAVPLIVARGPNLQA
eukprot:scaffold565_cov20-Tisochrysis_lutea.AAC.1